MEKENYQPSTVDTSQTGGVEQTPTPEPTPTPATNSSDGGNGGTSVFDMLSSNGSGGGGGLSENDIDRSNPFAGKAIAMQEQNAIPDILKPEPTPIATPQTTGDANAEAKKKEAARQSLEDERRMLDHKRNSAKAISSTVQLVLPRACAAYSGADMQRYKMTAEDINDFETALYEYLKTVNVDVSPAAMLVTCCVAIFGGSAILAYQDKKAVKAGKLKKQAADDYQERMEKAKRERALRMFEQETERLTEPKVEEMTQNKDLQNEVKRVSTLEQAFQDELAKLENSGNRSTATRSSGGQGAKMKRTSFAVNKKTGFYVRDENGGYIPASDQWEKPSQEVQRFIDAGLKPRQIRAEMKKLGYYG